MDIIPLEFSIVVVGQDCNPTILNPDFLRCREIVPEDWGWDVVGPAITTPSFATVTYSSGITIKVESTRFQVSDNENAADIRQSKAAAIARRYIEVLPHVRYTGVGSNFRSLVQVDEPDAFLSAKFLTPGRWNQEPNNLIGINLKLVYPHGDGRLTLSLAGSVLVRERDGTAEKMQGVLAHANYHRPCEGYPTDQAVLAHIGKAADDQEHFIELLEKVLSDGADH